MTCIITYLILALAVPSAAICEGKHCAIPLQKGDTVPFDGQLLSTPLSIDLGLKAHFCQDRIDLELKFQRKSLDLDLQLERRLRDFDRESWKEQKSLLRRRLEEAHSRPWYEHPGFITAISVITTVLVLWGVRETLKKID